MVPSTSVLRCEIDVEVRRLSGDPCELCDITGRPRDVYETSNFDVECRLIRDGPIDVGVLSGIADFISIFSRSASAVTPSEKKVQLTLVGSPLYGFSSESKMNIVRCHKPPKGAQKRKMSKFEQYA